MVTQDGTRFLSVCVPDHRLPKHHVRGEPWKENRPTEVASGQLCGRQERPVGTKTRDVGTEDCHMALGPGSLADAACDS